jgi:spore coat polysaccharide biosynthesis protein SpsF
VRMLAFIQARMGSTRLPGKVLEPLAGKPALERIVERLHRVRGLSDVAVLTSREPRDEPLRRFCAERGITVVAGSEDDVLDRFEHGARELGAEAVLRVTADCPLVDPGVLDELIALFDDRPKLAYAAVATGAMPPESGLRRYPDGLDAEVVSASVLHVAWEEAEDPYEREHVTPFIWRRPERFELSTLEAPEDWGDERWTIDHPADLEFVRAVYDRLERPGGFGFRDVLELLALEPGLRDINAEERGRAVPVRPRWAS